jgi:pyruvate dehydrogenase E2 component (dihydrolipoyllysine-residue acetyltransferase)
VATEVKLPRLGQGMESGTIVKWLKAEGDEVQKGEPLYELDTDKVTQEVEADASGVLLKIAIPEGEVEVGRTIAVIGKAGEEVPDEAPDDGAPQSAEKPEQAPAREPEREVARSASTEAAPSRDGGRIKASPLARRIARERGVELAQIRGTGPDSRIVAEDVERAAAAAPAAAPAEAPRPAPAVVGEVERVPLTSLRKTIARRLTEAWSAPAFQISMSADMTRALAIRARLVELAAGGTKPTISDLLTKVCAAALMRHREVNATFADDAIELHPSANVGLAVATEKGLVVPVIRGCERLTIAEIAGARADVVERARTGKLQPSDLEDGTFTISNLGMYGVESFVAVLNPPQAAILAVGAVEARPVASDGAIAVSPMLSMTLTCDHRSLDGAVAADFLRTVKTFLEEPGLAL